MTRLKEAFEDLTEHVPAYVELEPAAAWTRGRRRRHRRHAVTALAVAAVLGLLSTVLTSPSLRDPQPAGTEQTEGVRGYPQRIEHQWLVQDLPAEPGPLAGLLQGEDGWYAFSPIGRLWRLGSEARLTEIQPTLSPDGRTVVWLDAPREQLVVHDVTTGEERRLDGWSDNRDPIKGDYFLVPQNPHHWSPNGRRLLAGFPAQGQGRLVLDIDTGTVTTLDVRIPLAGWYSNEAVLGVQAPDVRTLRVSVIDLEGEVGRRFIVRPEPILTASINPWDVLYSVADRTLAVLQSGPTEGTLHRIDLEAGTDDAVEPEGQFERPCPMGFVRGRPFVHDYRDGYGTLVVEPQAGKAVVSVDPRLGSQCVILAADAPAGTRHGALFGDATAWWSWWWRELALGAALMLGCYVAFRRWRTRPKAAQTPSTRNGDHLAT